jgi:patatin-like phospholipase/acyl hydrolase
LLCIDGGGPGCYSQLVILKEVMSIMAYDQGKDLEDMVLGDYFDFIGGTGFGACGTQPSPRVTLLTESI